MSRARAKLVVLATTESLENGKRLPRDSIHRDLFQYLRHKGVVLRGEELTRFLAGRRVPGIRVDAELWWPEAEKVWKDFAADLEAAREQVILGLAPEALGEPRLRELVARLPKKACG